MVRAWHRAELFGADDALGDEEPDRFPAIDDAREAGVDHLGVPGMALMLKAEVLCGPW